MESSDADLVKSLIGVAMQDRFKDEAAAVRLMGAVASKQGDTKAAKLHLANAEVALFQSQRRHV